MKSRQGYADVNGTRLYYEVAGAGSPVVLIHGLGSDRRVWDAQFTRLAGQHQVIRYDTRGHGRSAVPGGEAYTHAGDLSALLAYLGIARATVIGQSMGGGIALDFALAYPDQVTSLVLVDPTLDGYEWSAEYAESWSPFNAEVANSGPGAALPLLLAHPLLAPSLRQPAVKARLSQILAEYSGWHFSNDDPVRASDPPAMDHLEQIGMPVLLLIGELDLPDFHAIASILAKGIPHARLVELADVGHVAPMEAPEQFNALVLGFLAQTAG